jgi:DNA modification methylase
LSSIDLYCSDVRDILTTIGPVDALVTDPPYGIGEARGRNKSRVGLAQPTDYGVSDWDDCTIDDDLMGKIMSMTKYQIIFGGNFYKLAPTSCWLVWDKMNYGSDFADCELAWTNLKKSVRMIRYRWNGFLRQDKEPRYHPTQKPVNVMVWCIEKLPSDVVTIFDPFMGSGSTGVACARLGKRFVGVEKDSSYFDIAQKRIEATSQYLF